jgi:hypothetical protein
MRLSADAQSAARAMAERRRGERGVRSTAAAAAPGRRLPVPRGARYHLIDAPNTYLYYVLGGGKAVRYGIGVGREGFTWSGVESISRMAEWPDWSPPAEMISRQPYLPRFMAGGPGNPLGAGAVSRQHRLSGPRHQ